MYNLVCYPHYTCGGLLCDIFNNTWSQVGTRGNILNREHSLGKIGDSDTVFKDFDQQVLVDRIDQLCLPDNTWIGTHCWPSKNLCDKFEKIIVVTTATSRSQIYRWARAYHHFFEPQWAELSVLEKNDKTRETAKNYILPFEAVSYPNVVNLEFTEVVENTAEFQHLTEPYAARSHINRWQQVNAFLYDQNFWNSTAAKSIFQAEYELKLDKYYQYN